MRTYNLTKSLLEKNEKSLVIVDDSHKYFVNNSYKTIILIQAIAEDMQEAKDPQELMGCMNKIIAQAIGQEGADYIASLDLSVEATNYLVENLINAVKGTDEKDDGKN